MDFTIISYPGQHNDYLLSLADNRSRYMLPFGGRFRVADFTVRNSFSSGADSTILFNNLDDGLHDYVEKYGPFTNVSFSPISVVTTESSNIETIYETISEVNSKYFVLYNGDNPSIIDFAKLIENFAKSKSPATLYKIEINNIPSMAHKIVITEKDILIKTIEKAIQEKRTSPNIFEMTINMMLHNNIKKENFKCHYWPIQNIPDYYNLTREVISNSEIFNLLYTEKIIQSKIEAPGYANLGENSVVTNSFMSDYCKIEGKIENSIIYPGVEIAKDAIVKDSIILPFVKIGSKAKVINTIVDESSINSIQNSDSEDLISEEKSLPNIGENSRIGSDELNIKNKKYPKSIFSSITLIGKNCKIPDDIKIGGGCYISSNSDKETFQEKKVFHDGLSI